MVALFVLAFVSAINGQIKKICSLLFFLFSFSKIFERKSKKKPKRKRDSFFSSEFSIFFPFKKEKNKKEPKQL
jgi:hypothetical protein